MLTEISRPTITLGFSGDLWIFPVLKNSLKPLFLNFKQHGSQWDAVSHGVSLGSKLFENIIIVSVTRISAKTSGFFMVQLWSPWIKAQITEAAADLGLFSIYKKKDSLSKRKLHLSHTQTIVLYWNVCLTTVSL